jgi:cytochrome c heme-lyase
MAAIVAIHNTTNERAWAEVLKWEFTMHAPELSEEPRLVKFGGKYADISPKARIKMFFQGAKRPFDRHDWIIDRNGKKVRYIIDFYDGVPGRNTQNMYLDVRPALDSFEAWWDRVRMATGFVPTLEEVYQINPKLKSRLHAPPQFLRE